ncbi:MAG: ABC transporter permease [Phycisphaerae bacterium]|nr:ABC transporter permease [Phycisphaerae bacterium]
MLSSLKKISQTLLAKQQSGLIIVILLLAVILTALAGSHLDKTTGKTVNNFFNPHTLMQTATDASFFAVMAVGATMVIISGGIDLSIGSIYALCGVVTAMMLRHLNIDSPTACLLGIFASVGLGIICGMLNGLMVVGLEVHPFIITLGTMWIFRGIAFVMSKAESILVPGALTAFAKANLGLNPALYPVAMLVMIAVTAAGAFYLSKTVMGRHIYAVGGNAEASRYAGLHVKRITVSVFAISGLTAGIAAFMGSAYYGSASCGDATGYELYVIASAVVGGASLSGGRGNAVSAMLGAILIILIRQSIRTLHFDQNYEWIIIGAATIIAVVLDKLNAQLTLKKAMK